LQPHIVVDGANLAHITWNDPAQSSNNSFRVWYGRGNAAQGFIPPYSLIRFTGDAYSKDTGMDFNDASVHLTYSEVLGGDKDRYYMWLPATGGGLPTPTPTSTPTNTPTLTPPPSPTARCPGQQFADVCPGDTFYPYIIDLAGLNAISGYNCGTTFSEPCYPPNNPPYFRPANYITRAQLVKVVDLAYAFPLQTGIQIFADVPPSNAFYTYIQTAYSRGIISGYTGDGVTINPCNGQTEVAGLLYFRHCISISRGQVSKVIALARGWALLNPLTPTFTDVAYGSPFYSYIETDYAAGVISGYSASPPCTTGTPCFLPNNNITRAQAAKMVDLGRTHVPPSPTPLPTATATAVPPTATVTTVPGTPTATPILVLPSVTVTLVPPTATVTSTPVPPTATP